MVLHCYLERYGTVSPTYWEKHGHLWYQSRYGYIHEAINKWHWLFDYARRVNNTPGVPDVFELDSYQPNDDTATTINLRFASPSLKVGTEHLLLHENNFGFGCPKALEEFSEQPTRRQQAQLRHFRFEI